jgi:chemotaxis protein MotB
MSYADVMTLLLAVFATMYAASAVDATKLDASAVGAENPVGAAFRRPGDGILPAEAAAIVEPVAAAPVTDVLEALRMQLAIELEQEIGMQRAELSRDGRGLVMSLPERATFSTGSAEVTPDARQLLVRLGEALQPLPNAVRVEGHSDDVPIKTPLYASNWELSTARAAAVVRLLVEGNQIHPERLSAAGYAEFHPRAANDSPENRARNRRIDLVISPIDPAVRDDETQERGHEPQRHREHRDTVVEPEPATGAGVVTSPVSSVSLSFVNREGRQP